MKSWDIDIERVHVRYQLAPSGHKVRSVRDFSDLGTGCSFRKPAHLLSSAQRASQLAGRENAFKTGIANSKADFALPISQMQVTADSLECY